MKIKKTHFLLLNSMLWCCFYWRSDFFLGIYVCLIETFIVCVFVYRATFNKIKQLKLQQKQMKQLQRKQYKRRIFHQLSYFVNNPLTCTLRIIIEIVWINFRWIFLLAYSEFKRISRLILTGTRSPNDKFLSLNRFFGFIRITTAKMTYKRVEAKIHLRLEWILQNGNKNWKWNSTFLIHKFTSNLKI